MRERERDIYIYIHISAHISFGAPVISCYPVSLYHFGFSCFKAALPVVEERPFRAQSLGSALRPSRLSQRPWGRNMEKEGNLTNQHGATS